MELTVIHAKTVIKPVIFCVHCDDQIFKPEDPKYVSFQLGATFLNFHENCFKVVLGALFEFVKQIIEGGTIELTNEIKRNPHH